MYSIDDLLTLVISEGAGELKFHTGTPPVIAVRGQHHTIEGPPITAENAAQLLRGVADTRQIRELRERHTVEFFYTFRDSSRFLIRAKMEDENVGIDIYAQPE